MIVRILFGFFFLYLSYYFYNQNKTELQRCKSEYQFLRTDQRLIEELKKQGTTFDERLEDNCKIWIRNGQHF